MAYPVADMLLVRNIPFIFSTGYQDDILRASYPRIRICHKPCAFVEMEDTLTLAMSKPARSHKRT